MKKTLVFSLVVLFGATTAMAAALWVPFYNDKAGDMVSGVPDSGPGSATFIGVLNLSGTSRLLTLTYRNTNGADITDSAGEGNTTTLDAGVFRSWRPYADDPNEGPGRDVPNSTGGIGSVEIDLAGGAVADFAGRVLIISQDGSQSAINLEGR